jgi:hypothetical protein
MMRILFFVLWAIPVWGPKAQGAIEIYANGHKYASPQEYLASKTLAAVPSPKELSDTTRHQLYVLSVENGVVDALQDFYENQGQSGFQVARRITSAQLQQAIEQTVTGSKDPKLLISNPGKMRIVAISPDK